jgi:hypothetical protein
MSFRQCALIVCFALAFGRAACGQSSVAPQAGVLVLRNGQVIEGDVTRAGDYYVVSRGEGFELRPKVDEVELFCGSMDEAYQFKAQRLSGLSAKSHLDLAKWCLRHGLFVHCSEQLTAATRVEPNSKEVKDLETRLKLAVETPEPQSPSRSPPSVAPDDLEKALRELPRGSIEKFGAIVQPILLNRCSANKCHGPNAESEYKLLRPPPGQIVSRRFTQRNLYASLRYLNRSNPDASPLIVLPQQRHGSSLAAVFDKQSANQLSELVTWARLASAAPVGTPPHAPATIAPTETTLSQPAASNRPSQADDSTAAPPNGEVSMRVMRPALDQAGHTKASPAQPAFRDRFDPEIFNRRYHGK